MKKHRLEIFDFIYCGSSVFGKGRVLAKLLKREKLNSANVLYVGDEIRDIEAARRAGIAVAAVSWGLNTKPALAAAKPDALVDTPAALLRLARSISRNNV